MGMAFLSNRNVNNSSKKIYCGNDLPNSTLGSKNDIYVKYLDSSLVVDKYYIKSNNNWNEISPIDV